MKFFLKKTLFYPFSLLIFAIFSFSFLSCAKTPLETQTKNALGTICSINLYEDGTKELYEKLFSRISQIENKMSSSLSESEISIFNEQNKNLPVKDFPLSDEVFEVLDFSLKIAEITNGVFDPTIGSLVQLWNINERIAVLENSINLPLERQTFSSELSSLPNEWQINDAKSLVNYKFLFLDKENHTLSCSKEGVKIELGGIAKGYVADELVKILKENNVKKAIIDLGGNIYAYGAKNISKDDVKSPWKIGIKNPLSTNSNDNILKIVECIDKTVVTSGSYERFFVVEDKIYHHIIDVKTGKPSETDLVSVSVICSNSMLADSLSTSFFVLGYENSIKLILKLNSTFDQEIETVFLFKDGSVKTFKTDE